MTLESVFTGGPWLGVALVQVTLVALVGLLAWLAVWRGGPALRGAVLLATLVGLLVAPGLAAVAPVWLPLPEFAWLDDTASEDVDAGQAAPMLPPLSIANPDRVTVVSAEPTAKPLPRLEEPIDELEEILLPPEVQQDDAPSLALENPTPAIHSSEPPRRAWPVGSVLAVVWLVGALVCLTRSLARLALLYRWAWRARQVHDPHWTASLRSLAERYGLPEVALRESPAITSPLTMGLFRPLILLPTARSTWSAEQQALILAHELAHVRRRDFLAGLVAELAACLCWFHPLVRWLAGRLRLEQEFATDAWAASASDSMNYVRCLARLALALEQGRGSLAPALWRRRPEILRRIDMLRRNPQGHSLRLGRGTAWTVTVAAAVACVIIAGIGPLRSVAKDPPAAEPTPEAKAPATADVHGDPLPDGALARMGSTRWRHGASVTYVAFGPDGQTLITASQDNTIRLWDMATGKEIRRFTPPKAAAKQPLVPPGLPGKKVPPDGEAIKLDTLKLKLETEKVAAEQAALAAVIMQRKKAEEAKQPLATVTGKKVQLDEEKAKLDAEKIKLDAKMNELKAKLDLLKAATATRAIQGDMNSLSVALAPDGKTLAAAIANIIQLYDVGTGKELRKVEGTAGGMNSLLFSPDGRTLAARGADGTFTLWDADSGKEIRQIKAAAEAEERPVKVAALRGGVDSAGMAFAPDGKTLAAVIVEFKEQGLAARLRVFDVTTGKQIQEIKAPDGIGMSGVAFAPSGKVLAYCANGVVHLCEAETGKEIRQIQVPDLAVSMLFSPDGRTLATRGRSQLVRLWDTETGKELHQFGDGAPPLARPGVAVFVAGRVAMAPEVRNLAFTPDGKRITTATGGTIRLWDTATGKEVPLSDGHLGPLAAIGLSPDGKTVVSWGMDQMIRRWEAASGKPLGAFRSPQGTQIATFSPDATVVALAAMDNSIRLHEIISGKEVLQFKGPPSGTAALAFAPDGKLLAAHGGDGNIRLYDAARGSELRQITAQTGNNGVPPGVVVVKAPGRFPGSAGTGLAFSPDGKLLAAPGPSSFAPGMRGSGGVIHLYDVATGKAIRKIESPQAVVSYAFSPDSRVLATENADQSITLWEVASGKQRAHLGKIAPAPAAVAAAGAVAFVKVAGAGPGFAAPAGPVTLAFAPDGRTLFTRGPDRSVRVWDVTSGQEIGQFQGHDGRIETIAAAPNGKAVATGSADTTLLLWDAIALTKNLPRPPQVELADEEAASLWADLASEDAGKALQAVLKLAGDPKQAAPFLSERLKPAERIDPKKIDTWVAGLESERFAVRQEASAELVKAGEQVVPALQKVLASQPTIETRMRVEGLLDRLTGGTLTTDQLRLIRAAEALERMNTPEARDLLRTLADGAPGALPTREAQAALARLPRP